MWKLSSLIQRRWHAIIFRMWSLCFSARSAGSTGSSASHGAAACLGVFSIRKRWWKRMWKWKCRATNAINVVLQRDRWRGIGSQKKFEYPETNVIWYWHSHCWQVQTAVMPHMTKLWLSRKLHITSMTVQFKSSILFHYSHKVSFSFSSSFVQPQSTAIHLSVCRRWPLKPIRMCLALLWGAIIVFH